MLIFHLKKKWFNLIKEGKKTHEYRIYNEYWKKRIYKAIPPISKQILYRPSISILFYLGYPSNKDYSGKRLLATVKRITIVDGKNTDLKYNGKVFDIEFELLEEKC